MQGYGDGQDGHYNPYHDENGEHTETERGLDHYNELALNGGPPILEEEDDDHNKYINTTSENISKQRGHF